MEDAETLKSNVGTWSLIRMCARPVLFGGIGGGLHSNYLANKFNPNDSFIGR